jgi:hypothetical protein
MLNYQKLWTYFLDMPLIFDNLYEKHHESLEKLKKKLKIRSQ